RSLLPAMRGRSHRMTGISRPPDGLRPHPRPRGGLRWCAAPLPLPAPSPARQLPEDPHDLRRRPRAPLRHRPAPSSPRPGPAAGAVIVPLLIASGLGLTPEQTIHLINADLFTCGIATIIQSVGFWKVGVRLPIIQGVTTTAVSPIIAIGLAATGGEGGAEGLPM